MNTLLKILRIIGASDHISAHIFEKHFQDAIRSFADLDYQTLCGFVKDIGATDPEEFVIEVCQNNFFNITKHFDFLCPSFEAVPFTPFFLYLRNLSHSSARLLLIAHSPGAWPLDWLLLRPLLQQGDLIIAPSQFARRAILFLCPEIEPFIHVIHHPLAPLTHEYEKAHPLKKKPPQKQDPIKLVTMGRIIETKLIHRQIEAVPYLIKAGYKNIQMAIAGSLKEKSGNGYTLYSRILQGKIRRLGLQKQVRLAGLLKTDYERARFLADAQVSINLSLTIEEAFPKASLEPLGLGVPVLATRWNGFEETVGNAGLLLPLSEAGPGVLDIDPKTIADGILHMLNHPISENACRKQAQKFNAESSIQAYSQTLQGALHHQPGKAAKEDPLKSVNQSISNTQGILGKICFLKPFSWQRMMKYHFEMLTHSLPYLEGKEEEIHSTESFFRAFLLLAVRVPISYFYAGLSTDRWLQTYGHDHDLPKDGDDLSQVMLKAVLVDSITTARSVLLGTFVLREDGELLHEALSVLKRQKIPILNKPYYEAASAYLQGDFDRAYTILNRSYHEDVLTEYDIEILKLWARVCRKWKKPELSAGILSQWLTKYPDSPGSGFVLLEHVYNRLIGQIDRSEVQEDIERLKYLFGSDPVIAKIETLFDA